MTMPVGAVEEYEEEVQESQFTIPTMPVHVVSSDAPPGRQVAAEHGYWRTFLISPALGAQSATPGAVRIANRSLRRRRLLIKVSAANGSTTTTEITPANPALGATFVYTVPAGQPQTLNSAFFTLNTSATVANRFMQIVVADATGKTVFLAQNNAAVVASTGASLNAFVGAAQANNGAGTATAPLPPNFLLQPGWTVTIGAVALQAGDQISNITLDLSTPTQSTLDGVILGNSGVINSGLPLTFATSGIGGGYVQIGDSLRWECQQELWAGYPASNVGSVLVSVCDEAYASDPRDYMQKEGENT